MNDKIIKLISLAIRMQESGIHFFSKSARRFHRYDDLKTQFDTIAKSKVANKHFFVELLALARNNSLNLSSTNNIDLDIDPIEKIIEDTLVVGDHSLPEEILKSAFMYLRESVRLINILKQCISGYDNEFDNLIVQSKLLSDSVKTHIHLFTEEVRFYGYE